MDLFAPLIFPTLLLLSRALDLFLTALRLLLPPLLPFLRPLDLLLSLLFIALLPLGAVLWLFLTSLFDALLPLGLLLVPTSFAFLLSLFARRLVFLTPLFSPAPSALSVREITCSHQRGGYSKRQSDLFEISHFLVSFQY